MWRNLTHLSNQIINLLCSRNVTDVREPLQHGMVALPLRPPVAVLYSHVNKNNSIIHNLKNNIYDQLWIPGSHMRSVFTLRYVVWIYRPVAPMVLLTLLEVGELNFESNPLGVFRLGLASLWYVALYSWDIEKIGLCVGFQLAETGLNQNLYQPSFSW